jgi:hypothetical protein
MFQFVTPELANHEVVIQITSPQAELRPGLDLLSCKFRVRRTNTGAMIPGQVGAAIRKPENHFRLPGRPEDSVFRPRCEHASGFFHVAFSGLANGETAK